MCENRLHFLLVKLNFELSTSFLVTLLPSNILVTLLPTDILVTLLPTNISVTFLPKDTLVTLLPLYILVTLLLTHEHFGHIVTQGHFGHTVTFQTSSRPSNRQQPAEAPDDRAGTDFTKLYCGRKTCGQFLCIKYLTNFRLKATYNFK
jgi:hypothetical protein